MAPQAYQPPQSSSLNDLIRQHCRDRLYVQPLHWTAQHLQLLGCRFVCRPRPTSSTHVNKQDTDLAYAVGRLIGSSCIVDKSAGLGDLFMRISNDRVITLLRDRLDFYFAGRSVAKLPCRVYGRVISNNLTPFLAHVDHSQIARSRENSISTPTRSSIPARRIREATLARLQPTNTDQDPYFASILIALAKARQHALPYKKTARSFKVHLLVTNISKRGFLRVYTATITAAFLRKLEQPSLFSDSSLIIQYASIPRSDVIQEIAAILPSKRKKRLRESVIIEQVACKRKKELGDGSGGEEIT